MSEKPPLTKPQVSTPDLQAAIDRAHPAIERAYQSRPDPEPDALVLSQWDRYLRDPSVDVTKLQALFELWERAQKRQAEAAFNASCRRLMSRVAPS